MGLQRCDRVFRTSWVVTTALRQARGKVFLIKPHRPNQNPDQQVAQLLEYVTHSHAPASRSLPEASLETSWHGSTRNPKRHPVQKNSDPHWDPTRAQQSGTRWEQSLYVPTANGEAFASPGFYPPPGAVAFFPQRFRLLCPRQTRHPSHHWRWGIANTPQGLGSQHGTRASRCLRIPLAYLIGCGNSA